MARGNFPLQTFNRGRISRLALARTDLDRTRLSAEVQTNWMPRTIGSMMVRPGLGYIGGIQSNNKARLVPFIRSSTDTALVEVSSGQSVVWVSDALVTRAGSTAVFTNGTFTTDLTGWTDVDEAGSTSEWVTGDYLGLTGTRFSKAARRQAVTSSSGDHGVSFTVERGRPVIKIGSSAGGDDYLEETQLRPGGYSFKITSTGNFDVELSANTEYRSLVTSIAVESSGTVSLASPWLAADLDNLRWKQSGDVIFVAADGYQQQRIERYGTESWAVVVYDPESGPFRTINTSGRRINPTALKGDITLEADQSVFKSSHVGALFEVTSVGQNVEATITGADQWSDSVRVSGVAETRIFDITVSAISTDITARVQRSIGEEGNWGNVTGLSWTSTIDTVHDDGLDNQIAFYRIGSGSTDFLSTSTAASLSVELNYASGGITGIARVTAVTGATESSAIVLSNFGSTSKSELWSEGSWSNFRGWPTSVTLHEGRMSWSGRGELWASVSDAFENFDSDTEGDSAPLKKIIGEGPTDKIEWMLSLTRLLLGSQGQEFQAKTSSLEEPLTPTNFSLRDVATQGSANVQAQKIDKTGYFVQQGGTRVFEVGVNQASLEFDAQDRTILVPEIGEPSISKMVVQRQPDTRLHCVRSDGTVGVLVRDPAENVLCWIDIKSTAENGAVEDAAVLPGVVEDEVYYLVRREVNGSTVRYLEKWAKESEARGDSTNKIADSFAQFDSTVASASVTGATHLYGSSVVVWGNGKDLGSATVSTSGTFTAAEASTSIYYGLPYPAIFRSAKLAYAAEAGTALTQTKKIDQLGIIAADVHSQGIQYGPSSTALYYLPLRETGSASTDSVYIVYDEKSVAFEGSWDTDSRLELWGQAPRPATVLAAIMTIETKERV